MNRFTSILALGTLLVAVHFTPCISAKSTTRARPYLLRTQTASVAAIARRHGLLVAIAPDAHGISRVYSMDERTSDEIVSEVASDPDVASIESDRSVWISETAASVTQSPDAVAGALAARAPVTFFGSSVWLSYIQQPAAILTRLAETHADLATGAGIVAVVDTGVDPKQPVLQGVLAPGYDFVHDTPGVASELADLDQSTAGTFDRSSTNMQDRNTVIQVNQFTSAILDQSTAAILDKGKLPSAFGHGTMVAGIVHLVAPMAQIMPLKVFKGDGTANISDIVRAVYYAVDHGARVINMSFSLTGFSLQLMKALNYATAHGVVCVASVGNDGRETLVYPAAFQNVIGVASTDNQDNRSSFSNFGEALAYMSAPGEGILTTYPGGGYAVVSGTSFSAPFVSGAAALMVQIDDEADIDQREAAMALANAKTLTTDLGFGRLDLHAAVEAIKKEVSLMTPH